MATPTQPRCVPVPEAARYKVIAVRDLRFDGEHLTLAVQGDGFAFARVTFRHAIGFRVLDERDLGEFWPACSEDKGWLWEVQAGGWMDLEKQRPLFNSHDFVRGLREYFVAGDKCVSVLCGPPPVIEDIGATPR